MISSFVGSNRVPPQVRDQHTDEDYRLAGCESLRSVGHGTGRQRPKDESNESVSVAPFGTLRNLNRDRSRPGRLSKNAHTEKIKASSSSTASALVRLGQQRSVIPKFPATLQTDTIGPFLDREDAAHLLMTATPDKLDNPPQKLH